MYITAHPCRLQCPTNHLPAPFFLLLLYYYVILQHISWIMVSSGCRVHSQHLLHHEQAEERNITAKKLGGGHSMLYKERLMVNYGINLNKTMAALLGCVSVKRADRDCCHHQFSTLPQLMYNFQETFLVRPDSFTIRQLEVLYEYIHILSK